MKWQELATTMDGWLWLPGDIGYPRVRRGFVGGDSDLLPMAAAACVTPHDVALALAFARSEGLPFAVRSGGHSYADQSSTSGLLIDLGSMRSVRLDGDLLTVGPGAQLGPVQLALAERNRCLPTGSCASVGIGGSTMAGGFGFLGRRHGLTADNLLRAEVVLADGRAVSVGEGSETDLDWALRGGGMGTLGIATELVFRTYPLPAVAIFHAYWPMAEAVDLVDRWQRWAPYLPPDAVAHLSLTLSDDESEPPVVELFGCALPESLPLVDEFLSASAASVEGLFTRTLSGPAAAGYLAGTVWRRGEELGGPSPLPPSPGFQRGTSEFFAGPIPTDAIEALLAVVCAERSPGEQRDIEFTPWGGAYGGPASDATAFVHRRPSFLVAHRAVLGASANAARRANAADWVRQCWQSLHPHGTGQVYQGYPDPQLLDPAGAYYGANLPRLRAVKAAYDSMNVFTPL